MTALFLYGIIFIESKNIIKKKGVKLKIEKPYESTNRNYDLNQILSFYDQNRLNFDLSCQRGLVWTSDQQQTLIDTLVNGEVIPEIMVNYERSIFSVIDGKQRLMTIINFIKGDLLWRKCRAKEKFYSLFGSQTNISFSDLPKSFQDDILQEEINFKVFTSMTDRGIQTLFYKLNNGKPLGPFQKEIAKNGLLRVYFSKTLLNHPAIDLLYSEKKQNNDIAEEHLINCLGLMLAMDYKHEITPISLLPKDLLKGNDLAYIKNPNNLSDDELIRWRNTLSKKSRQIANILDYFVDAEGTFSEVTSRHQLVFTIVYSYFYDLDIEQTLDFYDWISTIKTLDVVSSSNYAAVNVERWFNYINDKYFKN